MVDEDTRELVAHGTLHERSRDRRIHSPGKSADDQAVAHLLADAGHLVVDDPLRGPGGFEAGDVVEEALEHALAVLAVHDLGVELHAREALAGRLHGGDRSPGTRRGDREPCGRRGDAVAMRHPHRLLRRQASEEHRTLISDLEWGAPELAQAGALHRAAERLGHGLESVADAEDRHARVEERRIDRGSPLRVDAARAAGQHDRCGLLGEHLRHAHGVGHDLGVDVRLADSTGDELGVLGAEVDDEHGLRCGHSHDGSVVSAAARPLGPRRRRRGPKPRALRSVPQGWRPPRRGRASPRR